MKQATTTRTRFTISTRNLWGSTSCGLFLLLFAFLLSCKDNDLTLGFPREPRSFEVFYRELPVTFKQFVTDSMSTYNDFPAARTKRLLIGSYTDPVFGTVKAEIYTQIRPFNNVKVLETGAVYDSITLRLLLDYYNYGSKAATQQTFRVHELTETLNYLDSAYDQRSSAAYISLPIAEKSFTVNPVYFDQVLAESIKDTVQVSTPLPYAVGLRLFNMLASSDSTVEKFEEFSKAFKGLAIIPTTSDKIIGINPASAFTRVDLHYHVDTVKYSFPFYLDYVSSFTHIETNHAGSSVASLVAPRVDYEPINGVVFSQAGAGIMPKISFQPLIALRDTVPEIVFNSVEISIPVNSFEVGTPPPTTVGLRLVEKNNKFYAPSKLLFSQYLTQASTGNEIIPIGVYIRNDLGLASTLLAYDADNKRYVGYITEFAQRLVREDDPSERFLDFALFSMKPESNKAVDRFSFNAADVRFKVYYTKAVKNTKGD